VEGHPGVYEHIRQLKKDEYPDLRPGEIRTEQYNAQVQTATGRIMLLRRIDDLSDAIINGKVRYKQ